MSGHRFFSFAKILSFNHHLCHGLRSFRCTKRLEFGNGESASDRDFGSQKTPKYRFFASATCVSNLFLSQEKSMVMLPNTPIYRRRKKAMMLDSNHGCTLEVQDQTKNGL